MSQEPVGEPMARETDPTGTHGGNKGWDWMAIGAAIGTGLAVGAMILFPPAGLIGLIGGIATVVSTGTAAAAIGGKLGKTKQKEVTTTPCGEIKGHSTKTKCEGKWIARMTDKTSHGVSEMQTGAAKVLDQGLLVCRVGEASTCGGKKVIKGAARTLVGGPSETSGKPSQDELDDALLDKWIGRLDTISTVTGLIGLGTLFSSAARVGFGAGLSKAVSRSVMADASKRAVYRQAYQAAAKTVATKAATPALARAAARKAGQQAVINTMGRSAAIKAGLQGSAMSVTKTGAVTYGVVKGMEYGKEGISSGLQTYGGMAKSEADLWADGVVTVGPDVIPNSAFARWSKMWPKQGKNYVLDKWGDFGGTMKDAVAKKDLDLALFGPGLFRPPSGATARSAEEIAGTRNASDTPPVRATDDVSPPIVRD